MSEIHVPRHIRLIFSKAPKAPSNPLTGYLFFVRERRNSGWDPDVMPLSEFTSRCGEEWTKMEEEARMQYKKLAIEDVNRYDTEFAAYAQTDEYRKFVATIKKSKKRSMSNGKCSGKGGKTVWEQMIKFCDTYHATSDDAPADNDMSSHAESLSLESATAANIFTPAFLEANRLADERLKMARNAAIQAEADLATAKERVIKMRTKLHRVAARDTDGNIEAQDMFRRLGAVKSLIVAKMKTSERYVSTLNAATHCASVQSLSDQLDIVINRIHARFCNISRTKAGKAVQSLEPVWSVEDNNVLLMLKDEILPYIDFTRSLVLATED